MNKRDEKKIKPILDGTWEAGNVNAKENTSPTSPSTDLQGNGYPIKPPQKKHSR
ncbi:MAG: hypothetical protein ACRC7V_02450 [Lachnospiraceae bacterium]